MPRAFLGIDGGGTATTARVEDEPGGALFERSTGPTNPHTSPFADLCARFDELLAGCPEPDAVAVCLAGMRARTTRERVGGYFRERFPAAMLLLEPDYAAAYRCFEPEPTVCVIAGTGSIVCSRDADGELVTSGGKGYLLGDQGSAYRLGRALVARYVEDPDAVDELGPAIDAALGVGGADDIIGAVHGAPAPAALLAAAAPVLCRAAGEGRVWARTLVDVEMAELATLVVAHADRHRPDCDLTLGLVGGVWTSAAAQASFESALRARRGSSVMVLQAVRTPPRAAVLLAREATT